MHNRIRMWKTLVSMLVMVGLLVSLTGAAVYAAPDKSNPRVLPPHSHAFGKTYGEWSAAWWQWALSQVVAGEPCHAEQSGKVWFLAGTPGGPPVTRTCTIPHGKAIFFPILTAEWSVAEGECPLDTGLDGTSEPALRACAVAIMDLVGEVEATIDGVPIQNLNPPASPYRKQSPFFDFNAVPGNTIAVPPGPSSGVSDGYWLMLAPLSTGQHTIHFRGTIPAFGFTTEVTYILTVGN